jgi:putative tricarboxylic transport membrane protein
VGEAAAIPKPQLYAGILVFATMGVYGMRQSPFDVFLLYAYRPPRAS